MKITRSTLSGKEKITIEINTEEFAKDSDLYLHFCKFAFEWDLLYLRCKIMRDASLEATKKMVGEFDENNR